MVEHLLISGATGAGKSNVLRWVGAGLLRAGYRVGFLDAKSSGGYAGFHGRAGVVGVADEPADWVALAELVATEMDRGYAALRAWRYGRGPEPEPTRVALLADELVDGVDLCGSDLADPVERTIRLGRETGARVVASLLRPDVAEGLSGLARRSLTGRLYLGRLEDAGEARMMFGARGRRARTLADGMDFPQGRGLALLGGRLHRVQIPDFADPATNSDAAALLPPVAAAADELATAAAPRVEMAARAATLRAAGSSWRDIANQLTSEGHTRPDGGPVTPAQVKTAAG